MKAILIRTLWGYRIPLLLLCAGLFTMEVMFPLTLKTMGGLEGMQQFMEALPEGLRNILDAQGGFVPTAEGFVATGYGGGDPGYLIIFTAFSITTASGAIAREIERGTILAILSRPIRRSDYLLARSGVMVIGLLVLSGIALAGTWAGSLLAGIWGQINMIVFLKIQLNMIVLAMALGSVSLLISARSSDGGRVIGVAAGMAVVMFFVEFLANLWDPARHLGLVSLYHYYDPLGIAKSNLLVWSDLAVLGGVVVVGFAGAMLLFSRRDIVR